MTLFRKIKPRFWLFFLLFGVAAVYAQDIPKPMYPPRMVNDFARLFSPEETQALEQKLRAYHDSTSTQIYMPFPIMHFDWAKSGAWVKKARITER